MALYAKLKVLEGHKDNPTYEMTIQSIIIGRSEQSDIFLSSEKVSRKHSKIEFIEGNIYICDLGSTNGTLVNGEKLKKGALKRLNTGDKIGVGSYLFEIEIPKLKAIY